jgi:hypothetical protein
LSDPVFVSGNTSSILKLSSIIDTNSSLTIGPQKSYSSTTLIASGQLDIISNAPSNLIGSPSNSQVSLSWTASNNIQGTLNNYLVAYRLSGQPFQTVLTNSTNNSYVLGQLINNSTYDIKVAPIYYDYANIISTGDFSQTISSTPVKPVEPIYLANGFISTINIDTVNDSEFPNAAVCNGFISVLTNNDISQDEFSNAAIANGYLHVVRIDPIVPLPSAPIGNGSDWGSLRSDSGQTVYNPIANGCDVGWVGWNPPVSDGGSAITGYKISGNAGTLTVGPQFRYANLGAPWTAAPYVSTYGGAVTVRAISAAGEGPATTITNYFAWYDCG